MCHYNSFTKWGMGNNFSSLKYIAILKYFLNINGLVGYIMYAID